MLVTSHLKTRSLDIFAPAIKHTKAIASLLISGALLSACASMEWYDHPPPLPQSLTPENAAALGNSENVQFVWRATEQTENYEFHIFNGETADIHQYMKKELHPDQVCQNGLCSITLPLDLPDSTRHAWRVRSVNVAGASPWTRHLFSWTRQR